MKTAKSICLTMLVLAGAALGAGGQPFRTDINPALLYYQAFLVAPPPMSDDDDRYLYTKEGRSQELPDRYGKLFAGYDNEFRLLRHAAGAAAPCDWGIDWSAGPATLLPHLARVKAAAVAVFFRVRWELQHDRQADACQDLLASVALGRNGARDGSLISKLVQIAAEMINCSTLAENFGRFTPETLTGLADGLDAGPARGTVAACAQTERAMSQDWLRRKILELQKANPGDDAKVMDGIRELLPSFDVAGPIETNVWERLSQTAGGTSAGVLKLVQDEDPIWKRLEAVLALPYTDDRVKQFFAEVGKSPNPFISLSFPAWEKAMRRDLRIRVHLAMVRAAVEHKLHGETGLLNVSDPAGEGRPFGFQRFVFEGVDRGFKLVSAYTGSGFQEAAIFVEKEGPPFLTDGPYVGQARQDPVKPK